MRQFLQFVTAAAIAGDKSVKETVIGVEVFGRAAAYDSTVDPIVRVEARRLRDKLQQYYDHGGREDPIVVNIPKGGYIPEFEFRAAPPPAAANATQKARAAFSFRPHLTWVASAALCGAVAVALWIPATSALQRHSRPRGQAAAKAILPALLPASSIAVLPLANLSGDPGQDYLADGVTDELITWLAKFTSLRVISRTSAMQYKGTRKTLPQIAADLGVDAIVEGSVTRSGRQLRITARLVDARVDRELWAEDYKRGASDILTIESDVARMVVSGVQLALSNREESQLRRWTNVDPEAWDVYLKGRYFWNKRTVDGFLKSIDYFQEAIAKAPGYAPAWAGLADSWLLLGETRTRPREEAFPQAQQAVDRALKLDDDLGEAHASRAALAADQGAWEAAEAEFRRALALSPSYATGHQWYAEGLAARGHIEEALSEIRRARELDPLSLIVNVQVGYLLFLARRYDEAIAQLRSVIDMDAGFFMAHSALGHVYEQKRMYAEAVAELERAADLSNRTPSTMMWLAHAWALAGRKTEARRLRDDLEKPYRQGALEARSMALLDLALGEPDRGLERIQKACAAKRAEPLSRTPLFDPLRSDARFAALFAHCGKPDAASQAP